MLLFLTSKRILNIFFYFVYSFDMVSFRCICIRRNLHTHSVCVRLCVCVCFLTLYFLSSGSRERKSRGSSTKGSVATTMLSRSVSHSLQPQWT